MGRLTGIPHFLTEYAWEEEKEDGRALRRARKELSADHDPLEDGEDDPVKACQRIIAQRMQRQSAGRLLRRTVSSKDWEGNPLVALPPCKIIHVTLDLTPRELEIITSNGEALKDTCVSRKRYIVTILTNPQCRYGKSGHEAHHEGLLY